MSEQEAVIPLQQSEVTGRVLCIGETMAVVTPHAKESLVGSDHFSIGAGGAESNVAGHLKALGFDALWLGRVGQDALGERILWDMVRRRLDTRWIIRDPDAPTGVYFKDPEPRWMPAVSYYRSGSAASRMSPQDLLTWPIASSRWVHVSGITPALSATCDALVETVIDGAAESSYGVSFDVNYRAALWPKDRAAQRTAELGDRCDVVLVGLDEAENLWGVAQAEDLTSIFPNARNIIVKDGGIEAVALILESDGSRTVWRAPAKPVEVVEAVGAGDAFAAGYLASFLAGRPPVACLETGHELAAWTLGSLLDFRPIDPSFASALA